MDNILEFRMRMTEISPLYIIKAQKDKEFHF